MRIYSFAFMAIERKKQGDQRLIAIGNALRQLRKDRKITSYYEVAHDLHISPSQYWRYEKGANMTLSTLLAILDLHKISLQEFIQKYVSTFES